MNYLHSGDLNNINPCSDSGCTFCNIYCVGRCDNYCLGRCNNVCTSYCPNVVPFSI